MRHRNRGVGYCLGAVALMLSLGLGCASTESPKSPQQSRAEPMVLVVMDPLAKELACACVEGFGQRDYRKLAVYLKAGLGREVVIEFSDDLGETLDVVGKGREVIVVGEQSLVMDGAQQAQLKARPVCALSDVDGSTTDTAVFVARANDPAKDLKDIAGRKVFVALAEADAKHAATLAALGNADLKHTSTYLTVAQVGLQGSMRRFGTQPLHSVAPEAESERPPTGNDQPTKSQQVTVN